MKDDMLKKRAEENAEKIASGLKNIGVRENALLAAWTSVEYARLRAEESIETIGIYEPNTSRGQRTTKESKAVAVLVKCTAASTKLLNELFGCKTQSTNQSEEDEMDEIDDY